MSGVTAAQYNGRVKSEECIVGRTYCEHPTRTTTTSNNKLWTIFGIVENITAQLEMDKWKQLGSMKRIAYEH